MHRVTEDRLPILEKWNSKRYTLSIDQLMILYKIKKTRIDTYGNRSEFIEFPCSVITKSDAHYAKSIITITNMPPIYKNPSYVLFPDEIKNIMPSPYSLPIAVRKATAMAQEAGMGFFPTMVQSQSGKKFILNGICNFFEYREIKGENIKLLSSGYKPHEKQAEYYPAKEDDVYYFYVDFSWWFKAVF